MNNEILLITQKINFFLLIFLTIMLTIHSCQTDYEFGNTPPDETEDQTPSETGNTASPDETYTSNTLGRKLKNPYSVKNMKKALDSLHAQYYRLANSGDRIAAIHIDIVTTHLYIRFKPKNQDELELLYNDTTLIIYPYPLDYDIQAEYRSNYRDPEVPEGQPTYQYCAVKVNQELPTEVEHEVLEHLFIPDEMKDNDNDLNERVANEDGTPIDEGLIEALVNESLRLTDNVEPEPPENQAEPNEYLFLRAKWRPKGRIRVWDDRMPGTITRRVFSHWRHIGCYSTSSSGEPIPRSGGSAPGDCSVAIYNYETTTTTSSYVPVEGAKVRARRWFTTHEGLANADGYYSCDGRFRFSAHFSIIWERQDFTIRKNGGVNILNIAEVGDGVIRAEFDGPRHRGDWNQDIRGGEQEYYATIFRAAFHYYYKNIKGLRRPPMNRPGITRLKIWARTSPNPGGSLGLHYPFSSNFLGIDNPIMIFDDLRSNMSIYATTIHELAHASHFYDLWGRNEGNWGQVQSKVKESWARGVEWELTRMVYPPSVYKGQGRSTGDYTLVVPDMIDDTSSYNVINFGFDGPRDSVSGYTIRQIEDALSGTKTWDAWKRKIRDDYDNPTKNHLNRLFHAYR